MSEVESPCVFVCTLDADDVCIGCGRTGSEIAEWSFVDDDRKQEVVERSARRLESR